MTTKQERVSDEVVEKILATRFRLILVECSIRAQPLPVERPIKFDETELRMILEELQQLRALLPKVRAALRGLYQEIHCQPDSPSVPDNKYHHILNANEALALLDEVLK